jgi:hypothetical protein
MPIEVLVSAVYAYNIFHGGQVRSVDEASFRESLSEFK